MQSPAMAPLRAGQPVEAFTGQGQVSVGQVTIRHRMLAGDSQQLPAPARYLLFLVQPRRGYFFFGHPPLLIDSSTLRYPWAYTYPRNKRNALNGKRVEEIAAMVRRIAAEAKK